MDDDLELTPMEDGSPAFTIEAMRKYLQRYPSSFIGPTVSGKSPTIDTIEFMTSKQACELMHGASSGLSDDEMICYVVLRGPFIGSMISYAPGTKLKGNPIVETVVEVFDARTGNLLVGSVGS